MRSESGRRGFALPLVLFVMTLILGYVLTMHTQTAGLMGQYRAHSRNLANRAAVASLAEGFVYKLIFFPGETYRTFKTMPNADPLNKTTIEKALAIYLADTTGDPAEESVAREKLTIPKAMRAIGESLNPGTAKLLRWGIVRESEDDFKYLFQERPAGASGGSTYSAEEVVAFKVFSEMADPDPRVVSADGGGRSSVLTRRYTVRIVRENPDDAAK